MFHIYKMILASAYSELPNSSGVPNKCMVAYNFFDLLHKNARFWSFLAYFWFKINSRGATTIRQCRVIENRTIPWRYLRFREVARMRNKNKPLKYSVPGYRLSFHQNNFIFCAIIMFKKLFSRKSSYSLPPDPVSSRSIV